MRHLLVLPFLLAACDGFNKTDNSPDSGDISEDGDEDGVSASVDCDDADPSVGGPTPWYADQDGDGFGDPDDALEACDAPEDRVADATDCDDANPDIHPGGTEICDEAGVDEDCDGYANADDASAEGTITVYRDMDTDGFGDPDLPDQACGTTDGWVLDATDCDDTHDAVHPGAVEVCDGLDDDCDPATDEAGTVTLNGTTPFTTIQDAIGASGEGAIVSVCAGTWYENLVIKHDLSLVGYGDVVLDAGSVGPAVLVEQGVFLISGFTLTHGTGSLLSDPRTGGGALFAWDAEMLTVEDCTFVDNTADFGGALIGPEEGSTTIVHGIFEGNTAGQTGGAFYVGEADIRDVTATGNTAIYGGVFYVEEKAAAAVEGLTATSNTATYGGAFFLGSESTVSLVDLSVQSNTASYGGGLYVSSDATVSAEAAVFDANTANSGGGAYVYTDSTLHGGTYTNNTAERGGGLYGRSNTTLQDLEASGNTASYSGGGVEASGGGTHLGLTLTGNTAQFGGGLLVSDGTFSLSDLLVQTNAATEDGGGMYVAGGEIAVLSARFNENAAESDGGGVFASGANLSFDTVTIAANTAVEGAGVLLDSGEMDASDVEITANVAEDAGGGFYLANDGLWDGGVLSANEAYWGAGAMLWGTQVVKNATFSGNAGSYAGGVFIPSDGFVVLEGVVLDGNVAEYKGGAALVLSPLDASDTTFIGNSAEDGGALAIDYGVDVTLTGGSVTSNVASDQGGGARLIDGTLASDGVDWGSAATENTPSDVDAAGSVYTGYGAGATFDCSSTGGCE